MALVPRSFCRSQAERPSCHDNSGGSIRLDLLIDGGGNDLFDRANRSDWNAIVWLRMLRGSFCITAIAPWRINMAKMRATDDSASNGRAAKLRFVARHWRTAVKFCNNMDAVEYE